MSKKQKHTQKQTKKVHSQDINESDQSNFFSLLADDYTNNGNIKLAQKILGDYKTLLEYHPSKFWATLSYNLNLQNSLDLFLRHAPRKHFLKEPLHFTGYYGVLIKEIFKCVFAIYLRLIDLQNEDAILYEQIGVYDLVYQKWIFDIMKLTDICTIYGEQNDHGVKKICQFVFKYQAYQDDYKSTIDSFMKNVLGNIYEEMFAINNKSANENEIIINDVQRKMELLTLILDSIETAIVWAKYFPQQQYLFKTEVMQCFEQIFYELILAKGYSRGITQISGVWKPQFLQNLHHFLKQAVQRFIDFFVIYFKYLEELIVTKQIKQAQEHMNYLIQNFGIIKRKFKFKKVNSSQNKEWILFEALYENGFNMIELLMNTPWNQINLPKEDIEEVTLQMTTVMEERERLKGKANNTEPENFDAFENFDPTQSTFAVDIMQAIEQDEAENEEQTMQIEEDQPIQAEEKLIEIVSKKKQKLAFDQPLKDRIEMAEITAKLYNDEPDDTYDYQEALQRPEKEYKSSDEDEYDDYVPNDHFIRYAQPSKKSINSQINSGHSMSYQNLDNNNDKQVKILKKPSKQQQQIKQQHNEPGFSDEENDQFRRDNGNRNNNNNDNRHYQEKHIKVHVKDNHYQNNNDEYQRKNQNNNNQQYRNKNRNQEYSRNDDDCYKRDDYDRDDRPQGNYEQKKVLQKERNRDGGYVGTNKPKIQQEYEEKQESQQRQPYEQKQNNNNKHQQGKKNLNSKANDQDLYVPKEETANKEYQAQEQRQEKKHQRGQKRY
ncbi:unnamed protein product (macronuclear) [Paramecium tetraurelia]|uniref:Uncharacterized protein n=1 Tax=Paramecium tetraurelia TaxID=5888 RepID=A0BDX0_PARTE|nr:uncharacterized protein GSPATT00027767001 [Paramecium tetraurelia]CAK56737.1 unnamed protein product [Paramecium tetraurelia]|eukprot:XP_001424135.1 hypothetical protein (macronuclear) [Paramecium tetraurelia strain d4-2]